MYWGRIVRAISLPCTLGGRRAIRIPGIAGARWSTEEHAASQRHAHPSAAEPASFRRAIARNLSQMPPVPFSRRQAVFAGSLVGSPFTRIAFEKKAVPAAIGAPHRAARRSHLQGLRFVTGKPQPAGLTSDGPRRYLQM